MNQRLLGWKLALALLVPAVIIAAAAWIAFQALSDDNQDVATGDDQVTTASPTATPLPETQPIAAPTVVPEPTALPVPEAPTALPLPTAEATAVPEATPVPAPAPTAVPQPAATTPPAPAATSGPAPTATVDSSVVTVSCSTDAAFPTALGTGETFGPITAVTSPAEAAAGFQFTWNFGNGTNAISPATGLVSYDTPGTYTIQVTGTNATTGQSVSATCGTIAVTTAVADIVVACSVAPEDTSITFDKATLANPMTVTISWTPKDILLTLQYEFETFDPVVFANDAASGDTQTHSFTSTSSTFSTFWRHSDSGETGRVTCPAFPESAAPTPVPTDVVNPDPTATVAPTATPEPTSTPVP